MTTPLKESNSDGSLVIHGYDLQRSRVEEYFDRTASVTWERLTSDAPVSKIRATVRAGRNEMRELMLSWLPQSLHGKRVLDAGCGTGAMALELAQRGAHVVAIDLSASLINVAKARYAKEVTTFDSDTLLSDPDNRQAGILWLAGDLLDPRLGHFDYIVSMDCLIHYQLTQCMSVLEQLASRCNEKIIFTYAPGNAALLLMHRLGQLFPKGDRSPSIQPVAPSAFDAAFDQSTGLTKWQRSRCQRVSKGFYTSQAQEIVRSLTSQPSH
jgi:magnesium-protoporphyrin O-methyltransferase